MGGFLALLVPGVGMGGGSAASPADPVGTFEVTATSWIAGAERAQGWLAGPAAMAAQGWVAGAEKAQGHS